MSVQFITPQGQQVEVATTYAEGIRQPRFIATINRIWTFEGSWDDLLQFAQSHDWQHVSTLEAKERLRERVS